MRKILIVLALCVLAAGCVPTSDALPTVSTIEMAQTAVVLTQNAPPPAFQTPIAYPTLDGKLTRLPSWHSVVTMTFDGVDSTLNQKTSAKIEAQIYRNELESTRRVLFTASGAAFGVADERSVEAVRIANDYYWAVKTPAVCATVTDAPRKRIADLNAATLIGGINKATLTGSRDRVNGQQAWEYAFAPDDIVLNMIRTDNVGKYTIAAGSLWVAPETDAVVRLTLTVNVEDVRLLDADQPVTGQLRITYDLLDVGVQYNIAVPFGC